MWHYAPRVGLAVFLLLVVAGVTVIILMSLAGIEAPGIRYSWTMLAMAILAFYAMFVMILARRRPK